MSNPRIKLAAKRPQFLVNFHLSYRQTLFRTTEAQCAGVEVSHVTLSSEGASALARCLSHQLMQHQTPSDLADVFLTASYLPSAVVNRGETSQDVRYDALERDRYHCR